MLAASSWQAWRLPDGSAVERMSLDAHAQAAGQNDTVRMHAKLLDEGAVWLAFHLYLRSAFLVQMRQSCLCLQVLYGVMPRVVPAG